mmetsp:Transcript_108371/g.288402  ORF Transcript_108371/g.288402 Transcript_108371/m.288402 type:complete len:256 (-) Transcript_108371:154-921(-)
MRRWRSRPLCDVVRPSSVPSAKRRVRPKTYASTSSEAVDQPAEASEPDVERAVEGVSGSGLLMPSTSASETLAPSAGDVCLGCGDWGVCGWNGKAGMPISDGESDNMSSPPVAARHRSSIDPPPWGGPAATSPLGECVLGVTGEKACGETAGTGLFSPITGRVVAQPALCIQGLGNVPVVPSCDSLPESAVMTCLNRSFSASSEFRALWTSASESTRELKLWVLSCCTAWAARAPLFHAACKRSETSSSTLWIIA